MALIGALFALAPGGANAEEVRLDHRGAVGLLVGGGLELKTSSRLGTIAADVGRRAAVDLGVTYPVGHDGNELFALARVTLSAGIREWALMGGYRGYFGKERVKTFFDLAGALHWVPGFMLTLSPRVALGLQVELASVVGLYVAAGGSLGFGNGLRVSTDVTGGLQFRSYLLE